MAGSDAGGLTVGQGAHHGSPAEPQAPADVFISVDTTGLSTPLD
jgi:hypothetical protein